MHVSVRVGLFFVVHVFDGHRANVNSILNIPVELRRQSCSPKRVTRFRHMTNELRSNVTFELGWPME